MLNSKYLKEARIIEGAPIEYMAFSGGGAKGAIYSGAYAAAKEAGIFDGIKAVAGASAGAITAALAATGTSAQQFEDISKNTNLQSLLGKGGFSAGPVQFNKDGVPLYELIDKTIRENVNNFLKHENIADITKSGTELHELRVRCLNNGKIYFKDLALLRKYDPVQFKDLIITTVRKDTGDLTIFSSVDTPDVEIALACRASASIPIVFSPVEIDGKLYVDGGYRDNIPTKYFSENESEFEIKDVTDDREEITLTKKHGRTLAMAFGSGENADANIAIYSAKEFDNPSMLVKFLVDVLFKMLAKVGGRFQYTETMKETNEQLRENALNTIVLDTKGIDTLDFNEAQKYADYLHIKGYCQTTEYLNNHDLSKKTNKAFEHQNFLLNVYEIYNNENLNKALGTKLLETFTSGGTGEKKSSKWQKGIIENHDDKAKMLLSFCTVGALKEEELQPKLKDYIMVAALARNNSLRADTSSINALIQGLNDSAVPGKIKESFIETLAIDKNRDPRFDKNKTPGENIIKFQFTQNDIQAFINLNKNAAKNVQSIQNERNRPAYKGRA